MFGFGKSNSLTGVRADGTSNPKVFLGGVGGLGNVLGTIGATLQDINSGGETQSLARWQAGRQAQQEQARKLQAAQQVQQSLEALQANPNATRQDYFKAIAPALLAQDNFTGLAGMFPKEDAAPTRINTRDGIVELGPDGPKLIYGVKPEEKTPTVPFGWTTGPDGLPKFLPGGPADPSYIGQASGARAGGVAAHRAPPRGRSSGGRGSSGGASVKLPAGFVLD